LRGGTTKQSKLMKTKTYILTFFIFLSGVVFGQEVFLGNEKDSTFIKFTEKLYSLERLYLDIKPIEPTNTIQIIDKSGMIDKYKLKYIHRIGNAPSFEEFIKIENDVMSLNSSYSCTKYGTDYIVIHMARPTGSMNDVKYYYEIIRKEE